MVQKVMASKVGLQNCNVVSCHFRDKHEKFPTIY